LGERRAPAVGTNGSSDNLARTIRCRALARDEKCARRTLMAALRRGLVLECRPAIGASDSRRASGQSGRQSGKDHELGERVFAREAFHGKILSATLVGEALVFRFYHCISTSIWGAVVVATGHPRRMVNNLLPFGDKSFEHPRQPINARRSLAMPDLQAANSSRWQEASI